MSDRNNGDEAPTAMTELLAGRSLVQADEQPSAVNPYDRRCDWRWYMFEDRRLGSYYNTPYGPNRGDSGHWQGHMGQGWQHYQGYNYTQSTQAVAVEGDTLHGQFSADKKRKPQRPTRKPMTAQVCQPINSNQQFFPDPGCPSILTKLQGEAYLSEHCGGFVNSGTKKKWCVKPNGSRPPTKKNGSTYVYRYKCLQAGCPWAAQLKEVISSGTDSQPKIDSKRKTDSKFRVLLKRGSAHNHPMVAQEEPSDKWGLCAKQKQIIGEYISLETSRGRGISQITPEAILDHLLRHYMSIGDRTYAHNDEIQHLSYQICGYVQWRRQRNKVDKLGVRRMRNNDDLLRVMSLYELQIPSAYEPRNDYLNAGDISKCLGLSVSEMVLYNLSSGPIYDEYKKNVRVSEKVLQVDCEGSFFAMNAVGYYQLLTLAKREPGSRQLCADGTGGVCKDMSTLIVIGSLSVKYRKKQDKVSSSLRPIVYVHGAGERKHVYALTLYYLRHICWELFNMNLEVDWGTSDHAAAFVGTHLLFNDCPSMCDDCRYVTSPVPKHSQDKPESIYSKVYSKVQPSGTQMTQELTQEVSCDGYLSEEEERPQILDMFLSIQEEADDSFAYIFSSVLGATLCFFHVIQHFTKNNSFVKRIQDRSLAVTKVDVTGNNKTFYEHVCLIHHCTTIEQRTTVSELILGYWRSLGETGAAALFYDSYVKSPHCNWNYSCTGVPGVYPSNCANESFNHHVIKGTQGACRPNVPLETFILESLPNLLMDDALKRQDPCTIEIPTLCSTLCVGVTAFMEYGVDVVELDEGEWIANLGCNIGTPFDDNRRRLIAASRDGVREPFVYDKATGVRAAKRMVDTTRNVCILRRSERTRSIIGSCENCYKQLGYCCPGAAFLRNKYRMLKDTLETRRKTHSNTRNTVSTGMAKGFSSSHKGGLAKTGQKIRSTPSMLQSDPAYFRTLSQKQLLRLAKYLCLAPKHDLQSQEYVESDALLELVLSFHSDPTAFRMLQKKEYARKKGIQLSDSKPERESLYPIHEDVEFDTYDFDDSVSETDEWDP